MMSVNNTAAVNHDVLITSTRWNSGLPTVDVKFKLPTPNQTSARTHVRVARWDALSQPYQFRASPGTARVTSSMASR
jgi:hypothetical protein